jgi:hypothetical protein
VANVGPEVHLGVAIAGVGGPVVQAVLEEVMPGNMMPAPFGLGILNGAVLPESEYGNLIGEFMEPCYLGHPSWSAPFVSLSTKILGLMVSNEETVATRAICAFQLLPGLIQYANRMKNKGDTPIGLLRGLVDRDDPCQLPEF